MIYIRKSKMATLEYRLAPIRWVNEKLPRDLKLIPVTNPYSGGVPTYCWADWELLQSTTAPEKQSADFSIARFQQSLQMTSEDWLASLRRDIEDTITSCASFDALIDSKTGKLSPGTLQFRAVAEDIAQLLDSVRSQSHSGTIVPVVAPAETSSEDTTETTGELAIAQPEAPPSSAIRSRAEAYRMLEEAADFLQRTEPHSPTPYLVRRAVSWGKMNFNELLPELIRNNSELSEIVRLLQVEDSKNKKQ